MRYVKTLGLAAVAAAALMGFVGSASAIVVTEAPNDPIDVGDVVKLTSTHFEFTGSIPITCTHSELEATVTQSGGGSPTQDMKGNISSISWGVGGSGECGSTTVTTIKGGELTLQSTRGSTGTLTLYGVEFTMLTHGFFTGTTHCLYRAMTTAEGGTHFGTVTDKTLEIESAPIPQTVTDSLCGDDAVWHGDFTVTQPSGWDID